MIVGTQKGGTTSLHEYLAEHPCVSPPVTKEVHYFDHAHHRGDEWYRAHFRPTTRPDEISGESTPYYLFHPLVPELVARDLPDCRLIVILRNPIDRAFSHHNHERALGFEELSFEEAIAREPDRLKGEEERILDDPRYRSFSHQHHSYLARSRYIEQLERWFQHADRDRFLILSSEDLFEDPRTAIATTQRFLGLEPSTPRDLTARNARSYSPIGEDLRAELRREFESDNQRLYELVGRDFGWT
ncbi:MAG TPA: sulfotransferase domain-containing protein [Solirubrobacterales bacterium]|nr:sulfotransferase domain-containing protein [Solirubrobacterales bacterium]